MNVELHQVNGLVDTIPHKQNKNLRARLGQAKEFIELSFHTEVSLDAIARVACLEKHYFLREFKKYFNITPWKLLQDMRLKEANKLLATSDKKIHDICVEVGYKDSGSFGRLFKSRFGVTPGEARRISGEIK
jgi:transcriptional regulator GlxA family with amidase domain